jgi:hypothetical protein
MFEVTNKLCPLNLVKQCTDKDKLKINKNSSWKFLSLHQKLHFSLAYQSFLRLVFLSLRILNSKHIK